MVVSDDEQADSNIDYEAFTADLLELKQKLSKLRPKKAQRDLADVIIVAQGIT